MAIGRLSARYAEQFLIDNEMKRTQRAECLDHSYEVLDSSDDLVRDSKHRLRICFEDLSCRGQNREPLMRLFSRR